MSGDIEKSEQLNPDDVLKAITSFNDPSILTGIFKELGWDYSFEIREWLAMARQNANLSVKAKALVQLRKLLHEAAETAGYVANVSQTIPNAQGGTTTFSGKQMAGMLNPVKKIESTIKEPQNGKQEETGTESNRESNRSESERQDSDGEIQSGIRDRTDGEDKSRRSEGTGEISKDDSYRTDTLAQFPTGPPSTERCEFSTINSTERNTERCAGRADAERDVVSGGTEPEHGGETSGRQRPGPDDIGNGETSRKTSFNNENPCIQTKPPTCNQKLFPGISTSAEGD